MCLSQGADPPLPCRFSLFSPQMLEVLKACLNPEPVKRLSAIEVLALPYFDNIYELLKDTELQDDYDAAYVAAASANSMTAPSLWTSCSTCTERRSGVAATAKATAAAAVAAKAVTVTPAAASPAVERASEAEAGCCVDAAAAEGDQSPLGIASETLECSDGDVDLTDRRSEQQQSLFSTPSPSQRGAAADEPQSPSPPPLAEARPHLLPGHTSEIHPSTSLRAAQAAAAAAAAGASSASQPELPSPPDPLTQGGGVIRHVARGVSARHRASEGALGLPSRTYSCATSARPEPLAEASKVTHPVATHFYAYFHSFYAELVLFSFL